MKNQAYLFIKPHANTSETRQLVRETLAKNNVTIVREGELGAETIDAKQLVDQHYYAIASKATLLQPKDLPVPEGKFFDFFKLTWTAALEEKRVFNAKQACEKLGLDAKGLDALWAQAKKDGRLVKFGGGFYCGSIPVEGEKDIFVFNGFFMMMRNKFVVPGTSIFFFVVEFDRASLSWEAFRGQLLGPTDPADAPADSLRGQILTKWKALGLEAQPNVGDNGVHASASPFEGLAERANWLGVAIQDDAFGKALLDAGIPLETIKAWCVDPQVEYGPTGIKSSFFDALEDTDADECLARCQMIAMGAGYKLGGQTATIAASVAGAFLIGGLAGLLVGKKLTN